MSRRDSTRDYLSSPGSERDFERLDLDALADARDAAVPPVVEARVEALLREGRVVDACAACNIEVAFNPDRLPRALRAPERAQLADVVRALDPVQLLRSFPRRDDGSGGLLPGSVFLTSARLAAGTRADWERTTEPVEELWLRAREEAGRLVLELVAADARCVPARWDEVPWRFSSRHRDIPREDRFGASFVWERAFDAPRWLAQQDERRQRGEALGPEIAPTVTLLLLDDDRIEDALQVSSVALSSAAEALLADDVTQLFMRRLRALFPKATGASLEMDAAALAAPRRHLPARARALLRGSAPWNFARALEGVRLDWLPDDGAPVVPLAPLDSADETEAVWLGLSPGPTLEVFIARPVRFVGAHSSWRRPLEFEFARHGLDPVR